MKKKGTPGWDGWTLEIITEIFDSGKEWFQSVLNFCLRHTVFPRRWKIAKALLIPKEGKDLSRFEYVTTDPYACCRYGEKYWTNLSQIDWRHIWSRTAC
ncbi:hypothetical protein AVEN_151819-1 [Araneus ventricosus]|uniref:Reverse transcriptase domain-containing protein n=1 Tax=Araneus ventricosus TaxID=182803 RepID=A0A4Y2JBK1_ARAVE|nr:hypothetical protein AVEN_151819-1 [Araneus ventricosus]